MQQNDPWSVFPDARSSPTPSPRGSAAASADPWDAFPDHQPAPPTPVPQIGRPTGQVHDGDTFRLSSGSNGRLYGVDAFELNQTGRSPSGAVVPLGTQSRNALIPFATPQANVTPTGASTYGRPVVSLDNSGDAGQSILAQGLGLATPEYLRNDPAKYTRYMEAERLARLNRRGAFADTFQSPSSFRHGAPDPWAKAEWSDKPTPGSQAVFWDEPTPFQGLRPEIEKGYLSIWQDRNSKPEDLISYAQANGFTIDPADTRNQYATRDKTGKAGDQISYSTPPRVLTDPGDGKFGTTVRGFADPFNLLDESGAIVDTLGGTEGRESLWNSDRRFGDIFANNLDQNRSIIAHDDATHPYYRMGGQFVGGMILPGGSIKGVATAATERALAEGAPSFAAGRIGERAVRNRLMSVGGIEGGAAGAGSGEDWTSRATNGLIGTGLGATAGLSTGLLLPKVAGSVRRRFRQSGETVEPTFATDLPEAGAAPTTWDHFPDAAMDADMPRSSLDGPEFVPERMPDRIDVGARPRALTADPTEAQRAAQAAQIEPDDVLPLSSDTGAPMSAGNIRLDKLDSPQAIDRAITVTDQRVGGFDPATRGRVTQEQTAALAADLGMTADELLARRKGQAFNAEQALASRQILAQSGNDLVNLARRVQSMENPGEEVLARFRQAWVRHVAIQEQVAGATAEAGRALASFRMLADSRAAGRVLPELVDGAGGSTRLKEAADLILQGGDDPVAVNKAAQLAMRPRLKDKLVELWYNSLLSGPQTHAVNILGNTMTALAQLPEHVAAASVGAVRKALPGQADTDRVLFSEFGARAIGLLQGTREGFIQAARTMRTGEPADAASKVEAQAQRAISGIKGSIIRTPTRALSAEDELFKAMARRMEIAGLAVRQADREGLRGDAARQRIGELVANPTPDMTEQAFDYGRYLTFQRPLDHDSISASVSRATQKHTALKLILPFIRTPVNILKFAAERSPVAPFMKEWRADVLAGGARRDLAVAKAMVGSGIMATVMQSAGEGDITGGGPADDSARSLLRADGWQPYSIRIDGKYYSYARLDPLSTTLGVAADFAELQSHMTDKQRSNVAMMLATSTVKNLSNKVWFSGVADLSNAISDSERYGGSFVKRLAGSMAVPTSVAQVARTMDPTLRETRSTLDAIRARLPGLSTGLLPKRDVWGGEIKREGGLGPDFMSPVFTSTDRNDPVNSALLDAGAHVGKLGRKVAGRDLTDQEYDSYQAQAGMLAHQQLLEVVQSQRWRSMDRDDRAEAAEDVVKKARKAVRRGMFAGGRALPAPKSLKAFDPWSAYPDAR